MIWNHLKFTQKPLKYNSLTKKEITKPNYISMFKIHKTSLSSKS